MIPHKPHRSSISRAKASSFPFWSQENSLQSKTKFSVRRRCRRNLCFGATFALHHFSCNTWARRLGLRNLAREICIGEAPGALFHQVLENMKVVVLVEKQPLFLLPPLRMECPQGPAKQGPARLWSASNANGMKLMKALYQI
jgi:hypothetical protein